MTKRKFHMEDPQTLGNTIQNSVTLVTWQLVFVHHCHKAPSYITLSFQVLVFFVPKILFFFCFLTPEIYIPLLHRESVSQPKKISDEIVYTYDSFTFFSKQLFLSMLSSIRCCSILQTSICKVKAPMK